MSLRLIFTAVGCLAAILAGSALAQTPDLRFQAVLIGVGQRGPAVNERYDQWRNLVASQVKQSIGAALSDLADIREARYLQDFDIIFRDEPRTLTLSERERRWREQRYLKLIEGIPAVAPNGDFRMRAVVYLGPPRGALRTDVIALEEKMRAGAIRATADALVLVTFYALMENAIETGKPTFLVCALLAQADSFARDVTADVQEESAFTGNLRDVVSLLQPALNLRRNEHACRVTS